jgi:AraC family transcriptional regulator
MMSERKFMEESSVSSARILPGACCVLLNLAVRFGSSLSKPRPSTGGSREALIEALGTEIVRFQDGSIVVDDVAAAVLALDRSALPCLTVLLYGGTASLKQLAAATGLARKAVLAILQQIQLAGYARRVPADESEDERFELTDHARRWIETIWGPMQRQGRRLLGRYPTKDLSVLATLLRDAREIQEKHAVRIRALLGEPSSRSRANRLRGGLSPAALRRVQLFVEANLGQPMHLSDLAERAALSTYHFARAFKTSVGTTPRAFIERRRIEKARQLLGESGMPLAEIALDAGFETQSRFTTAFRRATGFTPAVYRKGVR